LERVRDLNDTDHIAERFFSTAEVRDYLALPQQERQRAFFNCWTQKEAFVKAIGNGLSIPLDQFDVRVSPAEDAELLQISGSAASAAQWVLRRLDVALSFMSALASDGDSKLAQYDWDHSLHESVGLDTDVAAGLG
jgi:4'-phosphopantetheinyl transferase